MVTLARELSGLIVKLTNPAPSGPPDVLIALPGPIGPPGGRTQSSEVQRSTSTKNQCNTKRRSHSHSSSSSSRGGSGEIIVGGLSPLTDCVRTIKSSKSGSNNQLGLAEK